ncbi:uncharacterized protein LOC133821712 [Humulus lupulus]|uniref:uncharacterized protein LOC133821712 n=1 Tax=Humulus lupulus TaxID=3486 RepID=UPI002B41461A|nr:uncharacterized protein LOC133821712 [Humulus lupulus]
MEDCQNWLALCLLDEMKSSGSFFTWKNKQEGNARIYSKLDRVLKNEEWMDTFPNTKGEFQFEACSDHCYYLIKNLEIENLGFKPFWYFNFWSKLHLFKENVKHGWDKPIYGGGLDGIMRKLLRLKYVFKRFNRKDIGDVQANYQYAKEVVIKAQVNLEKSPWVGSLQNAECDAQAAYKYNAHLYESFLRQQSKTTWLQFGDENTSYFHASLKKRREENPITAYIDNQGVVIDKYDMIEFGNKPDLDSQLALIKPFSRGDVKKAFFIIHSIKSLGPDGYGSDFFKVMWPEIGDDVSGAILNFFLIGQIPNELNDVVISLVPKTEIPATAVDNRPITCCNTLYKCISKMLCSRLAEVLPYLVDLSKAYDTIDWDFLEDLLKALCFPSKFINWIMVCLCGTSYSLMMNGRIHGRFKGEKGLRQGDPIPPLLFVLVMDYLTHLLQLASQDKNFKFHPMYFCDASSLSANKSKSHIYFGGVDEASKHSILVVVDIEEASFPLKYLEIQLRPTKWKASNYGPTIKKIQMRLL